MSTLISCAHQRSNGTAKRRTISKQCPSRLQPSSATEGVNRPETISWLSEAGRASLIRRYYPPSLDLLKAIGIKNPRDVIASTFQRALAQFDPDQGTLAPLFLKALRNGVKEAGCRPKPALANLFRRRLRRLVSAYNSFRRAHTISWLSDEGCEALACRHYEKSLAWLRSRGLPEPSDVAAPSFRMAVIKYDPDKGSFESLYWRILRYAMIDEYRRQQRRDVFELWPENFDPAGAGSSILYADRTALDDALARAWRQLDSIEQRLVWLHYVVGFAYPDIGAQLDFVGCPLPQATLRSRVSRAIGKLRPFLLPFDDVSEDELIEAMHRTARAAGTLLIQQPIRPRSRVR